MVKDEAKDGLDQAQASMDGGKSVLLNIKSATPGSKWSYD